ncbi:hypothetical protein GMSM_35500 [Geomonas sp. Red276]
MAPEIFRDGMHAEMVKLGKALVAQLFVLLKTSAHYSEGHAAVQLPVAKVLEVIREIQQREEATLRMKGSHLYLGDHRLRPDAAGYEASRFLAHELKSRQVGRVTFTPEVTAADLRSFVYALKEADETTTDPYGRMLERMQARRIVQLEVEMLVEGIEAADVDADKLSDDRLKARLLYKKAITAMESVMASTAAGQPIRFRECKRVVQHLIDHLYSHESCLLGLTANRCHTSYGEMHAANVCLLALAMGKRLGLSKFHLCELGMAALFHDLGKAHLPPSLLDKESELTPEEQAAFETHPLKGVSSLAMLKGLDKMTSRIISGVFEHHLLADFSGYPRLPYGRITLFGRIVSLADTYDTLTSSRVHGRTAVSPDKAIRYLLSRAGKEFDAPLLKVLVSCVGLHGLGSLVLLDSGELAVVVETNPDPVEAAEPRVRVIADAAGRETDGEVFVPGRALPPRAIVATVDPSLLGVEVNRYLL